MGPERQGEREEGADGHSEEEEEAQPAQGLLSPHKPSKHEIELHDLTHLPYRAWCPICVKAKGKEKAHRKQTEAREGLPVVSMDYDHFGEEVSQKDLVTSIVIKDESTGCVFAHSCEVKRTQG